MIGRTETMNATDRGARATLLLSLLLLACTPGTLRAQTFDGRVLDAQDDTPVGTALVRLVDDQRELRGVSVADSLGRYRIEAPGPGVYRLQAERLGYVGMETPLLEAGHAAGIYPLDLLVRRAPLPIEGLEVRAIPELVERRAAAPSRVIAWDARELGNAIAPNVGSFLGSRGVAQFVGCGGELAPTDLPNCFWRRGRLVRIRVFVDDVAVMSAEGTGRFWAYDTRDLSALEFLPGCRQIRLYTRWFMDRVAEGRLRLKPMLCEPGGDRG